MKAVLQSLFCSLSLTSKRTTSTWGLNDPVVSLALNPTACAGSLPYSYTVQRMQQHPSCTYQCIGIKLQPCLTSISNTDLVKVDHSQAILAFLSTSCLPRFLFWCSMQSASHSLLRCSVQHRIAWKAAGCSQIRTDFALVFFFNAEYYSQCFCSLGSLSTRKAFCFHFLWEHMIWREKEKNCWLPSWTIKGRK